MELSANFHDEVEIVWCVDFAGEVVGGLGYSIPKCCGWCDIMSMINLNLATNEEIGTWTTEEPAMIGVFGSNVLPLFGTLVCRTLAVGIHE